jgi:hypothetical protein
MLVVYDIVSQEKGLSDDARAVAVDLLQHWSGRVPEKWLEMYAKADLTAAY